MIYFRPVHSITVFMFFVISIWMQSLHGTLKPSACSWDCKTAASPGRLQDFTDHCCLQSWRMKLEVKLALQKYRCKFNGIQWQRFYSRWKDMAHYTSKENCSLSDFLSTKRLSAQIYIFGGFMEHCGNLESQHVLAARFNLGTWCYYKVLQNVMQHKAGFLSTFTWLSLAEAIWQTDLLIWETSPVL